MQRAVVVHGAIELSEPEPIRVLGMDESRLILDHQVAGLPDDIHDGPGEDGQIRWRRTDPWETGFVDITGDQALLGRSITTTSIVARNAANS